MPESKRTARDAVDHLLVGAPDLDGAIAWFEALTGVRAAFGGSHPGVGTRNALTSLGAGQYVEIIAPDPAQSAFAFNLDLRTLSGPRLVTWAASTTDVEAVAASAGAAGLRVSGPRDGARARPDGTTLHWRSAGIATAFARPDVDPVPFFIQWSAGAAHPSSDAPAGCRLLSLELRGPDPGRLTALLASLGIEATVAAAPAPGLRATLDTPRGRVVID